MESKMSAGSLNASCALVALKKHDPSSTYGTTKTHEVQKQGENVASFSLCNKGTHLEYVTV